MMYAEQNRTNFSLANICSFMGQTDRLFYFSKSPMNTMSVYVNYRYYKEHQRTGLIVNGRKLRKSWRGG